MYVVSYDIDVDKTRNKIAKTLLNYGRRVQYSVFECDLTHEKYEEMYEKLSELMTDEIEGSIRIYRICVRCEEKMVIMGINSVSASLSDDFLII